MDDLISHGYQEEMATIKGYLPARAKIGILSATFPVEVVKGLYCSTCLRQMPCIILCDQPTVFHYNNKLTMYDEYTRCKALAILN